ncbi:MAG TPA: right-handed parallel beta-helix repeat-containing protein [Acidimicrobiales bacterium]|nr:right-handed parallel beta-helix repeat-containing protein [Acidimicrobiales bacterium]
MNLYRRTLICSSAVALAATTLVTGAGPVSAAHVACGQTITVSTTLDSDVGPCSTGLTIGADNVTLDLNGFTLSGTPAIGEGPGILVSGRTGVTVRNGTVTQFDTGVAIEGGSGNTLTYLRLMDNRSVFGSDYGEGALVFNSTGNTVSYNQVRNNGPYGGISLLRASGNVVEHNQITGNNMSTNNTSGIRLENVGFTASNANTIRHNLVQGSGLDGIQLFAGASDNKIHNNSALQNNREGITLVAGSSRNVIEDNQTRFNGFGPIPGNGIFVRGAAGSFPAPANNIIRRNVSTNNRVMDLRDGTPNCGTNVWSANQGNTGTPPCVFNP